MLVSRLFTFAHQHETKYPRQPQANRNKMLDTTRSRGRPRVYTAGRVEISEDLGRVPSRLILNQKGSRSILRSQNVLKTRH